jgi:Zinc finger, C2H2 type/C2H2-type zinc finger
MNSSISGTKILTTEKSYSCDLCSQRFYTKENMSKHIRTHHTSKFEVIDKNDFSLNLQEPTEVSAKVDKHFEFIKQEPIENLQHLSIDEIKTENQEDDNFDNAKCEIVKVWKLVDQFKCSKCGQLFDTEYEFETHSKLKHPHVVKSQVFPNTNLTNIESPFEEVFIDSKKQIHLSQPLVENTEKKRKVRTTKKPEKLQLLIKCHACGHIFGSQNAFNSHRLSHINMKSANQMVSGKRNHGYQCTTCEEQVNRHNPKFHFVYVHEEGEKLLRSCQDCNLSFKLYVDFRNHIKAVHKENNICLICGEKLESEVLTAEHKRLKHPGFQKSKMFSCDYCGKTTTKQGLISHMKNHGFVSKTEQAVCEQCGKTFSNNYYLNSHTKTVHDKTVHACSKCNKLFKNRKNLTDHFKTFHTKKSPCIHCGKMWPLGRSMNLHIKKNHSEKVEATCPICGIKKESIEKIKLHLQYTHSTRKYPCELGCGYAASAKYYLIPHYIAHKEISPETRAELNANIKNLGYYTVTPD